MVTVLHFIKFLFKLFLIIVLLPLILLWLAISYYIYQYNFRKGMARAGVSKESIRDFMRYKRRHR